MTSGAAGLGGGPPQPVTWRDLETQAYAEVTKKFVVGMVLDTLAEVIPFTHREYDELFKYRSESDRPTLHPLLYLRTGGPEPYRIEEERWQPAYQEMFDSLPDNVKDWMAFEMSKPFADRDPSYVIVNNLLTSVAKALAWLGKVTQPIEPNSQAAQNYIQNVAVPYIALRGVISQAETVLGFSQAWLNSVGPNYPGFDSISSYLTQAGEILSRFERLRSEVESGNTSGDVKQSLIETAFELDRLNSQYQTSTPGGGLGILGTTLDSLATTAAAWALTSGSPSLLIGMAIATIGLTSDSSEAGFLGQSYSTLTGSLLDGVLNAFLFGPRAELEELNSLYNELAGLE